MLVCKVQVLSRKTARGTAQLVIRNEIKEVVRITSGFSGYAINLYCHETDTTQANVLDRGLD